MDLAANRRSYDQLHYIGRPYLQTHPDRLAAMGHLYGMRPAPVERCRVLELACGDGANLIPMAYALPESTFLGVDLAPEPLAAGRKQAAGLNLHNLRLEVRDILDFPADAGQFDYIIAHGIYSWCPPGVRDRLLAVCAAHLAPQGIAFVSFNAYPGYHDKELQRQLMLFHLANGPAGSPAEEASRALEALEIIAAAQSEDNEYRFVLNHARERYAEAVTRGPSGLAWFHHDLLSDLNQPFYFHEFMDHASGHGLQFISDAFLRDSRVVRLSAEMRKALKAVEGDVVRQEQYLDFVDNMAFRQVLLCHDDVTLDRKLGPSVMQDLFVAGTMTSTATGDNLDPEAAETFAGPTGKITVTQRESKEALRCVAAAWPGSVSFGELLALTGGGAPAALAEYLLIVCRVKLISFRVRPSPAFLEISERPVVSVVAREQARTDLMVTNLQHELITLDPPERYLVELLDGTRDRAQLLASFREWLASGAAAEACRKLRESHPTAAASQIDVLPSLDTLEADLDSGLRALLNAGLLVA